MCFRGDFMELLEDNRKLASLWDTPNPTQKVLDYLGLKLAFLSCRVFSPLPGSVCAFFDCGAQSTLAFPGAIAREYTDYLSVLLSHARKSKGKQFPNNILFIFYIPGTAKQVCQTGIFRQYRVSQAFCLRQWDKLDAGVLAARKNETLSRSCDLTVSAEGQDALAAGIAFYNRATALEQALPEDIFRLLKFSRLAGNEKTVRIEGTLRTFQDEIYNDLRAGLTAIARELEEQTGCSVKLTMSDGFPAVLNPADLFDRVRKIIPFRELKEPEMDTDEFSWFQRYSPGMLLFIGSGKDFAQKALGFLQTLTEKYM